jgi:hypothetical protein
MSEETTEHTHEEAPSANPLTGFAVFINPDGHIFIERNVSALAVKVDRESTLVEVRRACAEIVSDIQAQAAAEYTILRLKALEDSAPKE